MLPPIQAVQDLNRMHCRHKVRSLCIFHPTMESRGTSYIVEVSGGSCRRSERVQRVTSLGGTDESIDVPPPHRGGNLLPVPIVGGTRPRVASGFHGIFKRWRHRWH